jgi:hypothetical protein
MLRQWQWNIYNNLQLWKINKTRNTRGWEEEKVQVEWEYGWNCTRPFAMKKA